MKTLSLWQPWANLLVHGLKRVETRGWPIRHRGPLLIHAAKKWDGALADLCLTSPFREVLGSLFNVPASGHSWTTADVEHKKAGFGMPLGAIIGRVDVVACVPTSEVGLMDLGDQTLTPAYWPNHPKYLSLQITEREKAFGDYSPDRFAFLCKNAVAFAKPIPYRGAQGLFEVPDELVREAA